MVKDRLTELKKFAVKNGTIHRAEIEEEDHEEDYGYPSPSETTGFLTDHDWADVDEFLNRVNDVKKKIEELESLISQIRKIHREVLRSPGEESSLMPSLNDVTDKFTSLSKTTNAALKSITHDAEQSTDHSSAEYRIKKNQAFTLKNKLISVLTEFNEEQVQYLEKSKTNMRTYLRCVGHQLTDDEIDEAIESGKFYNTKSFMLDDRNKQMLKDVEHRHQDILKLEKSITELHNMFQDVHMLVDAQGDILNNIEYNVTSATDYTQRAHRNVAQAKEMKTRNLKMKITLCIGLTILIFILVTLAAGAFCFYLPIVCRGLS